MLERLPQRFRWREPNCSEWQYGVVFPRRPAGWIIRCGQFASVGFADDPWEVLGLFLGDIAAFEWIDHDYQQAGDVMPRTRSTMTIVDDPQAVEEGFIKKGGQNPDVPTTKRPAPPVGIGSKTPTPLLSPDDEAYRRIADVMALAAVDDPQEDERPTPSEPVREEQLADPFRMNKVDLLLKDIRQHLLQASEWTAEFKSPAISDQFSVPINRSFCAFVTIELNLKVPTG